MRDLLGRVSMMTLEKEPRATSSARPILRQPRIAPRSPLRHLTSPRLRRMHAPNSTRKRGAGIGDRTRASTLARSRHTTRPCPQLGPAARVELASICVRSAAPLHSVHAGMSWSGREESHSRHELGRLRSWLLDDFRWRPCQMLPLPTRFWRPSFTLVNTAVIQLSKNGWLTGLAPATFWATSRRSAI
jgi:hypothetical protein